MQSEDVTKGFGKGANQKCHFINYVIEFFEIFSENGNFLDFLKSLVRSIFYYVLRLLSRKVLLRQCWARDGDEVSSEVTFNYNKRPWYHIMLVELNASKIPNLKTCGAGTSLLNIIVSFLS